MTKDTQKPLNPKREALMQLSAQAVEFRINQIENAQNENEVLFWSSKTLNYIMLNHLYKTDGATEFNTFKQWKERGATIVKGQTAFVIWGQPLQPKEKKKEEDQTDAVEDYRYFPLCFLFSDKQVVFPVLKVQEEKATTENPHESILIDDFM